MTVFSIIMATTWLLAGVAVLWVGIKAGEGTLPENKWIGIRTTDLLASDEAWSEGHKAAAAYLKASSIPLFIGALICVVADDSFIGWVSLPVVIIFTLLVLIASKRAHSAVGE